MLRRKQKHRQVLARTIGLPLFFISTLGIAATPTNVPTSTKTQPYDTSSLPWAPAACWVVGWPNGMRMVAVESAYNLGFRTEVTYRQTGEGQHNSSTVIVETRRH